MKKVLLVIASRGFSQKEYFDTKHVLESVGIQVLTASDKEGQATASDASFVSVDMILEKINPQDFDGIFFIGGPGTLEHLDIQESHRVLNESMLLQKYYGAICIAPRILAKAHVLVGKKATGWNGDENLEQIFSQNNVEYRREPVVVDGNIVTADGPLSAKAFAQAISQLLLNL